MSSPSEQTPIYPQGEAQGKEKKKGGGGSMQRFVSLPVAKERALYVIV